MTQRLAALAMLVSCAMVQSVGWAAEPVDTKGPMSIVEQGSFFVGGTDQHVTGLSGLDTGPAVTREGTITTGQMYRAVSGAGTRPTSAAGDGAWRRVERPGLGHDA